MFVTGGKKTDNHNEAVLRQAQSVYDTQSSMYPNDQIKFWWFWLLVLVWIHMKPITWRTENMSLCRKLNSVFVWWMKLADGTGQYSQFGFILGKQIFWSLDPYGLKEYTVSINGPKLRTLWGFKGSELPLLSISFTCHASNELFLISHGFCLFTAVSAFLSFTLHRAICTCVSLFQYKQTCVTSSWHPLVKSLSLNTTKNSTCITM